MTEEQKLWSSILCLYIYAREKQFFKGASGQAASYSFLKCVENEALEISASFYLFSLSLLEISGF